MTYADLYNLRDKDLVTLNNYADAIDGLTVDYDEVIVSGVQSIASATPTAIPGVTVSMAVEATEFVVVHATINISAADASRYGEFRLFRDAIGISSIYYVFLEQALTTGRETVLHLHAIDEPGAGTFAYLAMFAYDGTSTTIYAEESYLSCQVIRENG